MRLSSTEVQERQFLNEGFKQIYQEAEERIFSFNFKSWLKGVLEDCMLTEFEEKVVCVPAYERDLKTRKNLRNGFYNRSLLTVFGLIEDLAVPRPRSGGYTPSIFEKHERRERKLNQLMTECFWRGISTRDMTYVIHTLTGVHVSASVVSRLTKKWDLETKRWHERALSDDYVYLMFDGVWIKNRTFTGKKRRLVLVAYGVKKDGSREVIDYKLDYSESEENWQQFLTQLTARGIEGKNLKLIVSDGCKGLMNAIALVFPLVGHQLCWAHKMRNILKNVKKKDESEVKKDLNEIFSEKISTREEVVKIIWYWRKKWRTQYPAAVRCLERDLDHLLHYLKCPTEHHKALRTSNHIERQFKEFRRRLKSMEILPTKDSADRALYALSQIRNEKLGAYPLKFTHNYLH